MGVCVRVCVRACVRECMRAWVRGCVTFTYIKGRMAGASPSKGDV